MCQVTQLWGDLFCRGKTWTGVSKSYNLLLFSCLTCQPKLPFSCLTCNSQTYFSPVSQMESNLRPCLYLLFLISVLLTVSFMQSNRISSIIKLSLEHPSDELRPLPSLLKTDIYRSKKRLVTSISKHVVFCDGNKSAIFKP